jgi:hypothetical protein
MLHTHAFRFRWRPLALALLLLAPVLAGGCAAGVLAGGMMESYRRSSTQPIASEYDGLIDKSFAVIVAADRTIESTQPQIVAQLEARITQRLIENADAAGVVPSSVVLEYQYNHPNWIAMTYEELADYFGVDRLIYIDVYEFRLNEPGNAYLWGGLAAGTVGVIEADGPLGDDFAYSKQITVKFPDTDGFGPTDYTKQQISAVLAKRFIDRITWLFYEHEEPYYPDY